MVSVLAAPLHGSAASGRLKLPERVLRGLLIWQLQVLEVVGKRITKNRRSRNAMLVA